MGTISGITDLISGTISYGLGLLIVATFLGAIRPALSPLLENVDLFPNGIATLAMYDLVILVFAGIGILVLLVGAIESGKEVRRDIRDQTGL